MGRFRSGPVLSVVSSFMAITVIVASVVLIISFIRDPDMGFTNSSIAIIIVYGVVYFSLCARMIWTELVAVRLS